MDGRPPRNALRPALNSLEDRVVPVITGLSVKVDPQVLRPNNRVVPVEVSGAVSVNHKAQPNLNFRLVDEYRRAESQGPVKLAPLDTGYWTFRFTIRVEASRSAKDLAGRQYTLIVAASDRDGSTGRVHPILVPHDPPKPGAQAKPTKA